MQCHALSCQGAATRKNTPPWTRRRAARPLSGRCPGTANDRPRPCWPRRRAWRSSFAMRGCSSAARSADCAACSPPSPPPTPLPSTRRQRCRRFQRRSPGWSSRRRSCEVSRRNPQRHAHIIVDRRNATERPLDEGRNPNDPLCVKPRGSHARPQRPSHRPRARSKNRFRSTPPRRNRSDPPMA